MGLAPTIKTTQIKHKTMDTTSELINETVIARIDRAGVFMGTLAHIDSDIVRLFNVRRIYYWQGALSVTDMASNGIKSGKVTLPAAAVEFETKNVVELVLASDEATARIKAIEPWTA